MKKMALVAAAVAAAGVTLLSSPTVLAQPAPAPAAVATLAPVELEDGAWAGAGAELQVSQAEVDRAVERHLHSLLKARLEQMRDERARAAGVR